MPDELVQVSKEEYEAYEEFYEATHAVFKKLIEIMSLEKDMVDTTLNELNMIVKKIENEADGKEIGKA